MPERPSPRPEGRRRSGRRGLLDPGLLGIDVGDDPDASDALRLSTPSRRRRMGR